MGKPGHRTGGWISICAWAQNLDETCAEELGADGVAWRMPDPAAVIDDCRQQFASDSRLLLACTRGVGSKIDHALCTRFIEQALIEICLSEERR